MHNVQIKIQDLIIPLENTLDNLEALEMSESVLLPFYELYRVCREGHTNTLVTIDPDTHRTLMYYKNKYIE